MGCMDALQYGREEVISNQVLESGEVAEDLVDLARPQFVSELQFLLSHGEVGASS